MTPYFHPSVPPPPPPPPPLRPLPPPRAPNPTPWIIGLAVLFGGFVLFGGLFAYGAYRYARARSADPAASSVAAEPIALPPVERRVPHHAVSLLEGCSPADVDALVRGISDAIDVGAPLYNGGNFAGCYHLYEGTAADVERRLSPSCKGPASALRAGRERAADQTSPSGGAWAMRDAFDGLLEVVERNAPKQ